MLKSLIKNGNLFRFSENGVSSICKTNGGNGNGVIVTGRLEQIECSKTDEGSGIMGIQIYDQKLKTWGRLKIVNISQISHLEVRPEYFELTDDLLHQVKQISKYGRSLTFREKYRRSDELISIINSKNDIENDWFDNMAETQNKLLSLIHIIEEEKRYKYLKENNLV